MDDLYYFPNFELLIKVVYAQEANSIRYATHRKMTNKEKKVIERYVLQEVAPETDYYKRTPSLLLYMGVDQSLQKELKTYHVKDTLRNVMHMKENVDKKVKHLISDSLGNYYFERLGEKLVDLRQIIHLGGTESDIEEMVLQISELLDAYNQNTGQKIQPDTILPQEALDLYNHLIGHE